MASKCSSERKTEFNLKSEITKLSKGGMLKADTGQKQGLWGQSAKLWMQRKSP